MGAGLWAPAAIRGTFCVAGWQRTVFVTAASTLPDRIASWREPYGWEGFTSARVTEEGAGFGCRIAGVCKDTFPPNSPLC